MRFRPSHYIPPQRAGLDLTERQRAILALLNDSGRGLSMRDIHSVRYNAPMKSNTLYSMKPKF